MHILLFTMYCYISAYFRVEKAEYCQKPENIYIFFSHFTQLYKPSKASLGKSDEVTDAWKHEHEL